MTTQASRGSPSGRSSKDCSEVSDDVLTDRGIVTVVSDLDDLRDLMREFSSEREWRRFHDPKSLLLALVGEVGELAALLQWLPADEVVSLADEEPLRTRVGEEIADVLIYLVRLADILGVPLREAAVSKLAAAAVRYPADEVRGVAPPTREAP